MARSVKWFEPHQSGQCPGQRSGAGGQRVRLRRKNLVSRIFDISVGLSIDDANLQALQQLSNIALTNRISRVPRKGGLMRRYAIDKETSVPNSPAQIRIRGRVDQTPIRKQFHQRPKFSRDVSTQRRIGLLINQLGLARRLPDDLRRAFRTNVASLRIDDDHAAVRAKAAGRDDGIPEFGAGFQSAGKVVG